MTAQGTNKEAQEPDQDAYQDAAEMPEEEETEHNKQQVAKKNPEFVVFLSVF